MPLTPKGRKIMQNMKEEYGEKKGEKVFYASANAGRIKGVHKKSSSIATSKGTARGSSAKSF